MNITGVKKPHYNCYCYIVCKLKEGYDTTKGHEGCYNDAMAIGIEVIVWLTSLIGGTVPFLT